jgi:hypothetical protein
MRQIQYRLRVNGQVMVTGYTWDEARAVRATLAREYSGVVTLEAYVEAIRVHNDERIPEQAA